MGEEKRGGGKVLFQFILEEGRVQLMLPRAGPYFLVSSIIARHLHSH